MEMVDESINSKENIEKINTNEDSNNPNCSKKIFQIGYVKILVTAILTAIITSICQFALQKSQLLDEHDYWNKRYDIENIDKLNNKRIELVDEINKELLLLEIQAKEIKLKAAGIKYYSTTEQVKELSSLVAQYNKDIYLNAAKVSLASFYFSNEVDSLIPVLGKALELNFQHNLLTLQPGIKIPEFELDFETLDTLTKTRNAITKAMINEIVSSYQLKSK
jgi:hypothetical protein